MPRVPLISRDKLAAENLALWDELAGGRERLPPFTEVLMHRPPLAGLSEHLARCVRLETQVPRVIVELVVLMTVRELDCRREWAVHLTQARNLGAREEAIEAIGHRRAPEGLNEQERELFDYTRQLLRDHRATEQSFAAVQKRWGDVGIIDLTALIGFYSMAATVLNAFEIEPPPDPALQLPE